MLRIFLSAMLGLFTLLHELSAVERAQFVVPPEVFIRHTPERSFIGPGMFALESGDILMAAPWGRPPVHFEEVVAKFPVPMLYRSKDGGRTWREQGRMQMEWKLPGLISDGGTSFLRLRDGRLAVVFNRHVKGLHGGGAPVIALSGDDGDSWTAANALIENDDAFYVMNDRLIQLSSGRLLLPVARKVGKTEGDRDEGLAMLSDDGGATWRLSRGTAGVDAPRGMAEPCVSELSDGRVLMLGRTGLGSIHAALSSDSGETWSKPEATTLESACSSLTLKTLPDGRLIVFYNHATPIKAGAFFPRTPLCYAVSEDGGKTWSAPVIVDDEGAADKGRQNIYPSVCFTAQGMVVMWSTHGADPKGSFKGQYDPNIGGGKRAVLAMPAKAGSLAATAVGVSSALPDAPQASDTLPSVSTGHVIVSHSKEKGRNGEASLIDLRDGSMLLMYGAHEKTGDWDRGEIRQIRSQDGGQTWSAPETVFHDAQRSLFQVAFARLANHDLGLTYTSLANGRDAFKVFRRSTDEGRTWSDPVKISDDSHEYTTGPWDKLYVLASGRVLALLHCNMKPDARKQGGPLGVYTVFSDDHGKTWTRSPVGEVLHVSENPYNKHEWGFWEPSLVETAPGRLLMLGRTTTGWLWETRSEDSGRTWSAPAQTSISNPVAPPVLTRIPDSDTLVLIQNPDVKISENWHGGERVALAFRTSRDGGNTWSPPTDIYRYPNADLWMDYPAVRWIQGQLHLVWRHTDRRAAPRGGMGDSSLYHQVLPRGLIEGIYPLKEPVASQFSRPGLREAETLETDICIYGGTPGGVMAAVQAARMGRKVVIVEPGRHLGGMTSGGLSAVDIGDPRTVGGLAREYFSRLVAGYGKKLDWDRPHTAQGGSGHGTGGAYAIEPHRAERVFEEMAEEAGVRVLFEARLASVKKDGTRILELVMENGAVVRGRMFLDTTYEGDLMAKADVGYTLTREGNQKYGESYNGIHYTDVYKPRTTHLVPEANGRVKGGQGVWDRDFPIDPYVVKRDPKSGLLPLINEGGPGTQGDPAPGVQAFCFRLCLSTAADRLPIAPPPDYDAKQYEIVVRFIDACLAHGDDMDLRWFSKHDQVPNQKWDFNTATFGGNLPGASHEWPEATYTRRVEIAKQHENYHRGLLHFLATDARVPQKVRDDISRFGLPRDEFTENGGWPHQLYIREARRMLSDLVLTEHHTHGRQVAPHSIGLGSYGTDTHEVRRIVKDGVVTREGKTAGGRGGFGPYQIGYGAIVPKAGECENLFVTFALSASHTAFSSIRMEPVFMVTSQSAATAACLALEDAVSVQHVNQEKLRARLLADGQVLEAAQQAAVRQPETPASSPSMPLRILLLGDSITRGSYLAQKDGKATGLPHPMSGGWRKALQDKLRAAGIPYDFVGELNYASFGKDGTVDPQFDPDHHGLAGFGNTGILNGGTVPTPADVLASLGVNEIKVPGIVEVLKKHKPDVILLMSGANGFDAPARDTLIRTIGKESNAHLFVANILPQKAPRAGWEKVDAYNASLPSTVAAQKAVGKHITFVNMYAAVTPDDLLPDGVHPNQAGMEKMAATWFAALSAGLAKER